MQIRNMIHMSSSLITMELSTFAYTVGILELLVGLPLLFYSRSMMKWLDRMMKEDVTMRMVGGLMVILGGLTLIDDYRIGTDVEGLVRLVAWLIFLKGILWAWWPGAAMELKRKWAKSEALLTLGGILAVAIGIAMMYAGMLL